MLPLRGVAALAVPRPMELMVKPLLLLGSFAVGCWANGVSRASVQQFVFAALAFEVLFYQGRYLLNDLFDRDLDRRHPAARARGRLAGLDSVPSRVLAWIAISRILAGVGLAIMVGGRRWLVLGAMVAATAAGLAYETLRSRSRHIDSGDHRARHRAIYLTVGLGYAIRVALGLALSGGRPAEVTVAAGYGYAFGVMFVTMTWALEAMCFVAAPTRALAGKGHVLALADYVPAGCRGAVERRVLARRLPFAAPWSVATIVAAGLSGWLGRALVAPSPVSELLILAALALAGGAVAVRSGGTWLAVTWPVIAGPAVLCLAAALTRAGRPVLVAVPLVAVLATQAAFRLLRPVDLGFVRPDAALTV